MNILRTVTLVAIFIKCVTASTDEMFEFRKYVDEGNLALSAAICRAGGEFMVEHLLYVYETKCRDFFSRFVKQANVDKNGLLDALHHTESPTMIKMIEEALEVFRSSQDGLIETASSLESMCSPNHLLKLLGKIEKQEDQKKVIRVGVWNLFESERTECLFPLLSSALGSKGSFKHLRDVAVKAAFRAGSYYGDKPTVERFHNHPAVTHEDHAQGLLYSGDRFAQNPIFTFLLGKADQADLIAVTKDEWYDYRSDGFKKAIEDALVTAKPNETRRTLPFQGAERVIKIFRENPNMETPMVIPQLIGCYLADESLPKPRIGFIKLVMKTLEDDDSGIGMVAELSEIILSYLVDELYIELITAPVKQTIGYKKKKRDDSVDKSAKSAHKQAK